MNAKDVIEAYVTEVALQIPRRQRNDVAFELRELLNEELQSKADAAGRGADAAMATELLNAFGRPADVAARYRPTLTIIDPSDGHAFRRAAAIGLAIIWCVGLLQCLGGPIDTVSDVLRALGQWWGSFVIPSFWWPGVLVVWYGAAAWTRRRWNNTSEWKPRARNRIQGGRSSLVLALVGIVCGVLLLSNPRWVLDVGWGGRAAPAAYEALTYTDTFRQRQLPWLLVLVLLNIPLFMTAIVQGRWSPCTRHVETGLSLVLCAVMAWTVLDGPVLSTPAGDRTMKSCLVLITAFVLITMGVQYYRRVRPAPSRQLQGSGL